MVWYSHLLKNFPQFVVVHTVKGFNIVNEAEVDVSLEFPCFSYDPVDVGNLISGSSAFSIIQLLPLGVLGSRTAETSVSSVQSLSHVRLFATP